MKAQDLMIGDWIAENIDEEGCDFPCCWVSHQVNADDFKFWDENDWIDVDDKCFSEFWRPIPLTQEILEKNGIVYDYDQEECVADYTYIKVKGYQYHEENVLIDYYNGHIKLINDITNTVVDMNINYVHELQHALKLCGIEKNIII